MLLKDVFYSQFIDGKRLFLWVALVSAKNHMRQSVIQSRKPPNEKSRKRQSS